MRRDLRSFPVNGPVGPGVYTRAMMIKHILTACAVAAAGAAGTSLAHAQQGYPVPPGAVYSPAPYPPGGYPADYRRGPGLPDFDSLEDDEAPQNSAALPPPGPGFS